MSFASAGRPGYAWQDTPTGSTARLRGLAAVSSTTAWASGSLGTVLRTTNGGATWQQVGPPGTQALQFRDIEAFDADHAVIMSVGDNPTDFRIYVTSNGGQTWALTFVNQEPTAFYDCMTFFDSRRGLALSDPPDGIHFRVIATDDGGLTWHVTGAQMPQALPGGVRLRGEWPVHHLRPRTSCLVRHGRCSRGPRLPLRRRWCLVDGCVHADCQRADGWDLRARLPGPAARARRWGRLPRRDELAGQLRADERRRRKLEPASRCARRISLGRDVARRSHGARSRSLRQ